MEEYGTGKMGLEDITIGITSFLRQGYLQTAINGIEENFTDCKVIVADDSDEYDIHHMGEMIDLPFDSGLNVKRNRLVEATKTKYFLLGTDDFVFDKEARNGVEIMKAVLDQNPLVDVVAARVNDKVYEGYLDYNAKDGYLRETRLEQCGVSSNIYTFYLVDIAVNYFLARTDKILPWEESLKIGGEHALWYLRMKQAERLTAWSPYANINTQPYDASKQDPRYIGFRRRAWDGHARMKKILGIDRYIDFEGVVS